MYIHVSHEECSWFLWALSAGTHLHGWVSTLACIINSPLCHWPPLWLRASVRGRRTIPADFNTLECSCVCVCGFTSGGLCANTLFQTVSGWCALGKDGAVPQKWKGAVNESRWHFRTPPQFLSCPLRSTRLSHGSAVLISWASDTALRNDVLIEFALFQIFPCSLGIYTSEIPGNALEAKLDLQGHD